MDSRCVNRLALIVGILCAVIGIEASQEGGRENPNPDREQAFQALAARLRGERPVHVEGEREDEDVSDVPAGPEMQGAQNEQGQEAEQEERENEEAVREPDPQIEEQLLPAYGTQYEDVAMQQAMEESLRQLAHDEGAGQEQGEKRGQKRKRLGMEALIRDARTAEQERINYFAEQDRLRHELHEQEERMRGERERALEGAVREQEERKEQSSRRFTQQEYAREGLEHLARELQTMDYDERQQEEAKQAIGQGLSQDMSPEQLIRFLKGLPGGVRDLVGEHAYATWLDKGADIESRELPGYNTIVDAVAISQDGKFMVTGSRDKVARILNANTGALLHTLSGHTGSINSVAISSDSTFIVTGSSDGTARMWDAHTGALIRTFSSGYTDGISISSVAISPDGQSVVIGSDDGIARIWDVNTGALIRTLSGHTSGIGSLAMSSDGMFIVTGSGDGTARIWNAATGALIHTLAAGWIYALAISPDGLFIVTGSNDGTARIWNAATGALIHTLIGHRRAILSVAISPDSRFVVTGSSDKTAGIWNANTGELANTLSGHKNSITSIAIGSDGQSMSIVTGSLDKTVRIWQLIVRKPTIPEPVRGTKRKAFDESDPHQAKRARKQVFDEQEILDIKLLSALQKLRARNQGGSVEEAEEKEEVSEAEIIKELIAQGANPDAIMPEADGVQLPLWKIAQRYLGVNNPVVQYLMHIVSTPWLVKVIDLVQRLSNEADSSPHDFSADQQRELKEILGTLREMVVQEYRSESDVNRAQELAEQAAEIYVSARPTLIVVVPGVLGGENKAVKGKKVE